MEKIKDIVNGIFGRVALPKAVQITSELSDLPEVKIGYVYTYDPVGYYVGPTCKVFMPYRIKRLLKNKQVEVVDGEIIISGGSSGSNCNQPSELAA